MWLSEDFLGGVHYRGGEEDFVDIVTDWFSVLGIVTLTRVHPITSKALRTCDSRQL